MGVKVGIDPGITGAIAVLNGSECVGVFDLPIMNKTSGKGNQINPYALHQQLKEIHDNHHIDMVYLERVNAMPGQGVSSVFSFGKSLGIIEGVLGSLALATVMPTPHAWKKRAGLTGKDKDAARTLAIQRFPEAAENLKRKKDIGRADALMIALFGE